MKAAQSRQKSYADRRRPLVFEVGDYVYLKVTPMKKKRFGVRRKLAARFVGPYKILERKGPVAYKLESLHQEVFACSRGKNRTSRHKAQVKFGIP
jgi:hypothetical protein